MKDQERRKSGMYRVYSNIPIKLFLRMKKEIGFGEVFDKFITEAIEEKFESLEENDAKKSPK